MDSQSFTQAVAMIKRDFGAFIPETVLSIAICLLLLHDVLVKGATGRAAAALALVATVIAGIAVVHDVAPRNEELFGWMQDGRKLGMIRDDAFARFFKGFTLLGTLIAIPMTLSHKALQGRKMGEWYALLLGAALGMLVMASATHLLMFFMGVEFASMASYLLTSYIKRDMKGSEAGMKYAIYGSVASAAMIFGMSLLYGLCGGLHITDLAHALSATSTSSTALLVAGALVFAGFAYKMAAFPMHFWCPDVYEGAPTPFAAFLSVTSKAAGFAVFIRFLMAFAPGFKIEFGGGNASLDWRGLITIACVASMTLGNLGALLQDNVKRMLAYSSIAHAGYLLMGVVVLAPGAAPEQIRPLLFYFLAYMFMNLGAFYVVTALESREGVPSTIRSFAGIGRRSPVFGICMTLFLFSLIGIPPTAGFTGKWMLLNALIRQPQPMIWLAVVAGLNTAISAYYYFRLVRAMWLDKSSDDSPVVFARLATLMVVALAIPTIWMFIDSDRVIAFAGHFVLG